MVNVAFDACGFLPRHQIEMPSATLQLAESGVTTAASALLAGADPCGRHCAMPSIAMAAFRACTGLRDPTQDWAPAGLRLISSRPIPAWADGARHQHRLPYLQGARPCSADAREIRHGGSRLLSANVRRTARHAYSGRTDQLASIIDPRGGHEADSRISATIRSSCVACRSTRRTASCRSRSSPRRPRLKRQKGSTDVIYYIHLLSDRQVRHRVQEVTRSPSPQCAGKELTFRSPPLSSRSVDTATRGSNCPTCGIPRRAGRRRRDLRYREEYYSPPRSRDPATRNSIGNLTWTAHRPAEHHRQQSTVRPPVDAFEGQFTRFSALPRIFTARPPYEGGRG